MIQERLIDGEEGRLNLAAGPASGAPILFLHGVLRRWQDFVPLLSGCALRWQVFGLDARGHGLSDRVAGHYLVQDYIRDTAQLVRTQFQQPVVLYGHSLGAMVAAGVAAAAPHHVRAVIMEDPPFETLGARIAETHFHAQFIGQRAIARRGEPLREMTQALADLELPAPHGGTIRLGDVRDMTSLLFSASCLAKVDPEVLTPVVEGRWLEGFNTSDVLSRVTCPALLLQGDYAAGGMLPDSAAVAVMQQLRAGIRIRLPGVGHLIHATRSEETLRLTTNFLETL